MKKLLPLFLITLSLFGLFLLVPQSVLAQGENTGSDAPLSLTAIPPRLGDDGSLVAKPGETLHTQIRVRNTSSEPVHVGTIIEDFIVEEDGRTPIPVLGQNDSRWSMSQWIVLDGANQMVPSGESQTISVLIHVPEDALPGGRYAMIMHEPKTNPTLGQTGINQRVGTLVYLRIAGEVNEEAFLRNIKVPSFLEYGPVPLKFSVENLSDIHIRPTAKVAIFDMFGQEKSQITFESQNVFPYTMREFSDTWQTTWGFGRYRAEITAVYGSQSKALTQTVFFWILPIKLILIVVLLFFVLLTLWLWFLRRRRARKQADTTYVAMLEERMKELENELEEHHDR